MYTEAGRLAENVSDDGGEIGGLKALMLTKYLPNRIAHNNLPDR